MESTLIRGFILLLAMMGFAATASTSGSTKVKANDLIPPCLPNTSCGITNSYGGDDGGSN
jgi:hypothetical protein